VTALTFDREYRTEDKTTWGRGPWQTEPDKAQWIDPATGLDCLIVRNGSGALCGYVGVPPEHLWHGKGYSDCLDPGCTEEWCYEHSPEALARVHGGLTFARRCAETTDESKHICHVPAPGRPADVWWFGFDCAHSGDCCPRYLASDMRSGGILTEGEYRDVAYVVAECARLAEQLAAVAQ
jgi:hypothetical protein